MQRGLVLRESQTEDRRVVLCKLSEKGQELVSKMWELGQVRARSLLETMTSPKLKIIAEAMEAIIQAASMAEQEHRH